jgi:soluble lytic murein transglycosylase-like protein
VSETIQQFLSTTDASLTPRTSVARPVSALEFLGELARAYRQGAPASGTSESAATQSVTGAISPVAPLPQGTLNGMIQAVARQEGVPPALLAGVVEVESGFQPGAVSKAGAEGLTQLMPLTAQALGVTQPFDPWQNLTGGARYLHQMITRYNGNLPIALAAYNAGPNAVDRSGGQIPPYAETQRYVRLVLGAYQHYATEVIGGGAP